MTTPSTSFSTRTRPTATLTESITTGNGGRRNKRPYDTDVTRLLPRWLLVTVIAVIIAFIAVPVLYILFGSVNSDVAVARGEYFPSEFTLSNYVEIWSTVALGEGLVNSMLTAGAVAVASAALAVSTAYVLVRFRFLGRLTILRGLLALQSIPGTLLLLPVFVVFSNIASATGVQIIGTRWGLFVTYLTFALPFSTWVMVTYLRGLPKELEEAARIDGAQLHEDPDEDRAAAVVAGHRRVRDLRLPARLERRPVLHDHDDPEHPDGRRGPAGARHHPGGRRGPDLRPDDGRLDRLRASPSSPCT